MGPLLGHVEHRQRVDVDANLAQLLRDQSRSGEGRALRGVRIRLIEQSVTRGRRHGPPNRRAQALHTAALLVDQHQDLVALDRVFVRVDQRAKLLLCLAIAGEQDEAAWPGFSEETPLVAAEEGAGATRDEGFEVHDAG